MEQLVTVLRVEEPARFNPDQLERLCAEIGEVRAEHEVAKALETISLLLREIGKVKARGETDGLRVPVRSLAEVSEHIGMATLARVSRDVLFCMETQNEVALTATVSRLCRIGDRSIHAIWDLEDLSG